MGQHAEHNMHENSLKAYEEELPKLYPRERDILSFLGGCGAMPWTDREIMAGLGRTDPNAVRPRITKLVELGLLEEAGKVVCATTGRTVRTVRVPAARH